MTDLSQGNYIQTLIYYKHFSYNYIYRHTHCICTCVCVYKVELPDVWLIANLTDYVCKSGKISGSFRSAYSLIRRSYVLAF